MLGCDSWQCLTVQYPPRVCTPFPEWRMAKEQPKGTGTKAPAALGVALDEMLSQISQHQALLQGKVAPDCRASSHAVHPRGIKIPLADVNALSARMRASVLQYCPPRVYV